VDLYGAVKRVQVPFVIGVVADLVGKFIKSPGSLEERRLLTIDMDNFDERLRALQPRASAQTTSVSPPNPVLPVDPYDKQRHM